MTPLQALIPRFEGSTALIFATGPSLPEIWNGHRSELPKIAVNDAWHIVPDADVLYACDTKWWEHHWHEVREYPALKVGYETTIKDVYPLMGTGETGFDGKLGKVRHGYNSGHQATHLAAQLGAKRIILIGFDMHDKNGEHFFGQHPQKIRVSLSFDLYVDRFRYLASALEKRGIEVLNCTPGSALPWFPIVDLEDVLDPVAD